MSPGRMIFGTLSWYSLLVVSGMLLAILLACSEEKRLGLPKDTMVDLALCLIPAGVVGARLYYVIFAWESYAADPISTLYIWEGGLAIYGGIAAGALAAIVFAKVRHIPVLRLLDAIAPGVALAQAVGRWGNFFNMEAYGAELTTPALQFFPVGVLIPEQGTLVWHMATFFYESCWDLLIFAVLWSRRKSRKKDGLTLLWYVMLYAAGRQMIEPLRMDSLMIGEGIRASQLLAAGLCMAALIMLILESRREGSVRQGAVMAIAGIHLCFAVASLAMDHGILRLIWGAAVIVTALMLERKGEKQCRQGQ